MIFELSSMWRFNYW